MLEIADAVVVGGGILGVAVTAALGARFSRVLLVEADRCGNRATTGGFAWVNASSKTTNEAYHLLNAEACRRHLALAEEWGANRTGWNGGGSLMWSGETDRDAAVALAARIETLQRWNYPAARLSHGEMQALEPYVHFGPDATGLFAPSESWVSTPRLVRFYVEQAREHHAQISEFTNATGFTLDHRGTIASVETTRGRVATRIVIICAGTETGNLAALIPGVGTMLTGRLLVDAPGFLVESAALPENARAHRVCLPAGANGFHIRPTVDGGLLCGADDTDASCAERSSHASAASHASVEASARATDLLVQRAASILPQLDRTVRFSPRYCARPMPADGLPIVGSVPGVPGAYLLASHSGVTLAPLLSQLLADEIITGRNSSWLADYRPDRFRAGPL